MPEKKRKISPHPAKDTDLVGRYGKIGISAVEAAARYRNALRSYRLRFFAVHIGDLLESGHLS
jgi:hypothetical protein